MKALVNAISYYLPEKVLTNKDISEEFPEWSVDKISCKVGINARHIADKNETAGDMALKAAEKLFEEYNVAKEKIDYLILCTQSPDYFLPTTSCILQDKLGLSKNIGAFDFNLGCPVYIYGLGSAKGLVLSEPANCVLLLTAETYSKYINKEDKSNKTIFGDAATATLISNTDIPHGLNYEVMNFCYGTDGSQYESLIVKNGAHRHRVSNGVNQYDEKGDFLSNDDNLYMDGKAIFNFTAFQVPPLIKKTLEKNNMKIEDINLFIFHQANKFMLDTVRKRCGIPENKFFIEIEELGNTVSNTIPIGIYKALKQKRYNDKTDKLLLSGFGVGLSMGAVVLKDNNKLND
jgi:3-oxoacyl-[acyl-carrier-protein] synthase-3